LSPLEDKDAERNVKAAQHDIGIGIGPIKLPEQLDRPQIITRTSRNELKLSEFNRWAGSLVDDFSNVFAENLSILLNTDRIFIFPWRGPVSVQYRVEVEVSRFDGALGEGAVLNARWMILGVGSHKMLVMKRSNIKEPTSATTYKAMVAGQSRAVGRLSQEIAKAINALSE
jgi:uncharacterized lipoprotein YmbA